MARCPFSPSRSTTVAGISRKLTGDAITRPSGTRLGIHDHQRHADHLPVQAASVEEQAVIAEMFAMIGRDDHQGIVENAAAAKLVEQDSQLTIEIKDTVVVNIDGHLHMSYATHSSCPACPNSSR